MNVKGVMNFKCGDRLHTEAFKSVIIESFEAFFLPVRIAQ